MQQKMINKKWGLEDFCQNLVKMKSEFIHPFIHSVTLLEIQWVPDGGLQEVFQQKRRALIQRSTHRIEEIKAKRALSKTRPESREKSKDSQPVSCKSKTKSKGGRAEQNQTTETSGLKQKKPQLPPPGI